MIIFGGSPILRFRNERVLAMILQVAMWQHYISSHIYSPIRVAVPPILLKITSEIR
jgi:hypothetical protein